MESAREQHGFDRELALGMAHPRGTELRRLGPYREALRAPARFAALPAEDRDVIVRWAETRRRMAERGVDRDPGNLADPLLDAAALRAFVLAGERAAGGRELADPGGDLVALVSRMRGSSAGPQAASERSP